jgi:DNA-binding CsgD family transcriptional regulator
LLTRQFEIADRLFELDPVKTYPKRGAEQIADLIGAQGYRLQLGEEVMESSPSLTGPPAISLPLEARDEQIGTLHLYGGIVSDEDRQIARWAARLLARGVRYARRMDGGNHQRTYEDVQAMLERTPLTPRERDVVGRLLSGASTRQIAESTGLTVATVNTYLKRIFAKLGVHSRVELVARVTGTRGVIPSEPVPPKREAESENPQP